jgi:hypothetical protein
MKEVVLLPHAHVRIMAGNEKVHERFDEQHHAANDKPRVESHPFVGGRRAASRAPSCERQSL